MAPFRTVPPDVVYAEVTAGAAQEYSQIFATAFVSGLQDAETDVPVPAVSHYRTWELTQACVEYLHSCNSVGLIPALHEAVCQAVTQSPRWLADDGLSDTRYSLRSF